MQIILTYGDIALASSLIAIVLIVSWYLGLKLTKTLLIAAIRTVIQLSFIVLSWHGYLHANNGTKSLLF